MFGINQKSVNIEKILKFKQNPLDFYKECLPGFKPELFNSDILLLNDNNNIHITGNRRVGTTTTIALTMVYKALFNTEETLIYFTGPGLQYNKNIFNIIIEAIDTLGQYSEVFRIDKIIKKRTYNCITFQNGNKIEMIPRNYFTQYSRGISPINVIIMLDEYNLINKNTKNDVDLVNEYLKSRTNVAILYAN